MRAEFLFDGNSVSIRLSVESKTEEAIAKLIGEMTDAKVSVVYGDDRSLYYSDQKPIGVQVYMKRPQREEQPTNDFA